MLIASYFGSLASAAVPDDAPDAYELVVTGIANLVAYWRLGDATPSTLADSSGNGRNGSYPTAPAAFGAGSLTWQTSDGRAVNFGGAGFGRVNHNAAFATARGTLCGYFRANSLASAITFVNKGSGFVLQALSNGTLQLTIGSTTFSSTPGLIEAGVEYHIAVGWDQVAVFLLCDGRVVSWGRGHTAGLTGNNADWQFGRTTGGANSNVRADEIAYYSRRLSWEELWELSEYIAGLPYHPTPETSQIVSTASALQTALTTGGLAPGHHILVAPGTYSGLNFTVPASRSGLKRRPIVVRPLTPGTVTMNGRNISFDNRWMVFDGFNANSGQYIVGEGARYIRFTRHTLQMTVNQHCFHMHGHFCRFDHNDISNVLVARRPYHIDPNQGGTGNAGFYNLIDHAHTRNSPAHANNGGPGFGLGTSGADRDFFICTMMYRNLFTDYFVDDEVVTTKSKGNIFIKNTVDCPGGGSDGGGGVRYPGRLGSLSWVESEWFEEIGTSSGNSGAGFFGADNVVIGCHLNGGRGAFRTGNIEMADYVGFFVNDPVPACFNSLLIGQTVGSGTLGFIVGHQSAAALDVPVRNTEIDASPAVQVNPTWAVNTTVSATARIPFTPAVKLTTSDVGTDADDPLVPDGYS
jgi:Chondroitinase B/Concanavalin A-like lectin/glucanases superfamily